ncbi:MAG TPA: DUF6475 domain-containing protein [Burkholderiaceae bacterium]|nr:DUF6475 domain-containing protein [Burkholderiaceae bacterium]
MQPTDKKRFLTLMTGIADYYGKELSPSVISLYWQGLLQFDLDAVEKALWAHTQNPDTGQFMPKIADVARMLTGTTQDSALVAWAKVDRGVRQVGTYADVVFDDPLIHRVLHDMGGWVGLGMKTDQDWPFVAREFENRYRGYRMRNECPEYPAVLIGIAGAHNRKGGFRLAPPTLIGNAESAQAVMLSGTDKPLIGISTAGEIVDRLRLVDDSGSKAA